MLRTAIVRPFVGASDTAAGAGNTFANYDFASWQELTDALDAEFRKHPTEWWLKALGGVLPVAPGWRSWPACRAVSAASATSTAVT